MNIKPLRQLKRMFVSQPARLNMAVFARVSRAKNAPECGTVGCIAGWLVLLNKRSPREGYKDTVRRLVHGGDLEYPGEAARILGCTHWQARQLFYAGNWPYALYEAYASAKTSTERVRVAIKRINLWIRTKGLE